MTSLAFQGLLNIIQSASFFLFFLLNAANTWKFSRCTKLFDGTRHPAVVVMAHKIVNYAVGREYRQRATINGWWFSDCNLWSKWINWGVISLHTEPRAHDVLSMAISGWRVMRLTFYGRERNNLFRRKG